MPIRNFGCVHAATARCATPDARGWADLARMGMQLAVWLGGSPDQAREVAQATGLAVVCPEESLFLEVNGRDGVNTPLVQKLVGELIRAGGHGRPGVICCADGSALTGLVAGELQLALGVPLDAVLEDLEAFEAPGWVERGGYRPAYHTTREYLTAMALAMRPGAPGEPS